MGTLGRRWTTRLAAREERFRCQDYGVVGRRHRVGGVPMLGLTGWSDMIGYSSLHRPVGSP